MAMDGPRCTILSTAQHIAFSVLCFCNMFWTWMKYIYPVSNNNYFMGVICHICTFSGVWYKSQTVFCRSGLNAQKNHFVTNNLMILNFWAVVGLSFNCHFQPTNIVWSLIKIVLSSLFNNSININYENKNEMKIKQLLV